MPSGTFYRWRGQPWPVAPHEGSEPKPAHAASGTVSAARIAEAEARRATFYGYRDDGWDIAEAAELTGVNISTGRKYEKRRRETGAAA